MWYSRTMKSADSAAAEYRDIPGFPGYRVGDDGSVWSCRHRWAVTPWRRLRPQPASGGYLRAHVYRYGQEHRILVHRLVLEVFVGPCPQGMEACHGNGVRTDNRASNLRWDTHAGNLADRLTHGTVARGERHGAAKLTEARVREIRRMCIPWRYGAQIAAARRFGVNRETIRRVLAGESWRHA